MNLYELSNEMKTLKELEENSINMETGEIIESEALQQLQDEISSQIQKKSSSIIKFVKDRDIFIDNIDNEIKRLQELKKQAKKRQDSFKNYIKSAMENMDIKKIETVNGTISLRKSEKTEIEDENLVPSKYSNIVQKISISKSEIKKDIKAGVTVPGAKLVENYSMTIK